MSVGLAQAVAGLLLIACSGSDADGPELDVRGDVVSFCNVAVPLLSEPVTFPGPIQNQMRLVSDAAMAHLAEGARLALANSIADLDAELELAIAGKSEHGWSTHRVVDNVAALCGTDNEMVSWSVQP